MKKETVKKLFIIIILFFFISISLFFADIYRILNNLNPLFSIEKTSTINGKEYIGFGYKIYIDRNENDIQNLKFGTWFSNFDN